MQQHSGGEGCCADALASPEPSSLCPGACGGGGNIGFPAWLTRFTSCITCSGTDPAWSEEGHGTGRSVRVMGRSASHCAIQRTRSQSEVPEHLHPLWHRG